MQKTNTYQIYLHLLVLLLALTGVVGKLISLDAEPLVWWRMAIASSYLPPSYQARRALDRPSWLVCRGMWADLSMAPKVVRGGDITRPLHTHPPIHTTPVRWSIPRPSHSRGDRARRHLSHPVHRPHGGEMLSVALGDGVAAERNRNER